MKSEISFRPSTHHRALKTVGYGTVFLYPAKNIAELWMVTDAPAPYMNEQVMCVNLKTGHVCDFDGDALVRVDFDAKVSAEFEN